MKKIKKWKRKKNDKTGFRKKQQQYERVNGGWKEANKNEIKRENLKK